MNDSTSKINIIKKGLARHLMFVFLALVLIPSLLLSGLSYQVASKDLYKQSVDKLSSVAFLQLSHVQNLVERISLDLNSESERLSNVTFLTQLSTAFKASKQTSRNFINSFKWVQIVENNHSDIQKFAAIYDYYDIFLIDDQGNILFTIAKEDDLGTNLFNGEYANTLFAEAAKKSHSSGKMVFSGFAPYAPSNNDIASFFVNVIVDDYGDKIGLIAFQTKQETFENIIESQTSNSAIKSYLFNQDLIVSTQSNRNNAKKFGSKLNSKVIGQWVKGDQTTQDSSLDVLNFKLNNDEQAIGVFQPLDIADKLYFLVAEVPVEKVYETRDKLAQSILLLLLITIFVVVLVVFRILRGVVTPIIEVEQAVASITTGNLQNSLDINANFELASLAKGVFAMQTSLKTSQDKADIEDWFQEGSSILNEIIRGEQSVAELSRHIIQFTCEYFNASIGAFYVIEDNKTIRLMGSYAFKQRKSFTNSFLVGEGMVGQAVLEQQTLIIHDLPDDYIAISSGLGFSAPNTLSIIPILWSDKVTSVIEIGSNEALNENQQNLLTALSSAISIALNSSIGRAKTHELLIQTQSQAEQLLAREGELRENNTMLTEQSQALEQSSTELEEKNNELQTQQEELRASNDELEFKTQELESSSTILEEKNADLDLAQIALEKKAEDLAISSKYKSEFLANMSHELRTPLNSLLILSKLLADNKDNNLDTKQIEYATTIHDSGSDLLSLINEILDLSKIEAGHMDIHIESINLDDFAKDFERKFSPLSNKKGITFDVINELSNTTIKTDGHKLSQIIKNLMSNAIKFTENGGVSLTFSTPNQEFENIYGLEPNAFIKMSVKDTGIGLAESNLQSIFEAFQQADGTTSRKFGGTGLGLSISRELSRLLGGDIYVKSTLGKGSEFSVILNKELNIQLDQSAIDSADNAQTKSTITSAQNQTLSPPYKREEITDDRNEIKPEDLSLLIIEDDSEFTKILCDVARDKGFKVLIASDGETGLYFADYYKPSGIILDVGLPGMDGWHVINRLKDNLDTRHIPVHFMSAQDKTVEAMKSGALGYLTKPISLDVLNKTMSNIESFIKKPMKNLLVVEDNKIQRESILELIGNGDVKTDAAESGEQALTLLKRNNYDCIVLDLGLPDMDGAELLEKIRSDKSISEVPVVVYSGKELNRSETQILEQYANRIIIKNARSPEMLLDETALFLHRVQENLPKDRQKMLRMLHDNKSVLEGREILIVDDDMRNIFALTTMLRDQGMNVTSAKNGLDALEKIAAMDSPDMVLMDIMMPEMDGYESMQKMRAQTQYSDIPIIALTAKAMKGDRAKCIKAGANDYLSKPINTEKLLSMMRVWLYR